MRLNGEVPTIDQVKTLALTNYGHFTSMLAEDGGVRGLSLHMQRLTRDCRLLFDVAWTQQTVCGTTCGRRWRRQLHGPSCE